MLLCSVTFSFIWLLASPSYAVKVCDGVLCYDESTDTIEVDESFADTAEGFGIGVDSARTSSAGATKSTAYKGAGKKIYDQDKSAENSSNSASNGQSSGENSQRGNNSGGNAAARESSGGQDGGGGQAGGGGAPPGSGQSGSQDSASQMHGFGSGSQAPPYEPPTSGDFPDTSLVDNMRSTGNSFVGNTDSAQEESLNTSGTYRAEIPDKSKFRLENNPLMPDPPLNLPPTDGRATATNYKPSAGAGSYNPGGGSGSAGYGGSAHPSGFNSSGSGINKPNVITGQGGGAKGGGRSPASVGGATGAYSGRSGPGPYGGNSRRAFNSGKYGKGVKLQDYLPGQAMDPRQRKIAAYMKRDGITGPNGPTIWEKITRRYRIEEATLMESASTP